jgi:hypothetical protein
MIIFIYIVILMSNQTQQSPMNISPQNVTGNCTYKCEYSFDYPVSNCTATNNGTYLGLSYNDSNSPVTFNNVKYNITGCELRSPSSQLYNNQRANGELFIMHSPTTGGNSLIVSIPLSFNGSSGTASNKISEIIDATSKGAPAQGGSTNQGIADFTLNDFIPIKEFYSYSSSDSDVVAFGMQNAIYISQSDLSTLQKIIKGSPSTTLISGPKLFINKKGPTKGTPAMGNDIYIDCQPTNVSEEEVNQVVNLKSGTKYDVGTSFQSVLSNPYFLLFLFSIIFIILIMGIYKGLSFITGSTVGGSSLGIVATS